VVSESKDIFGDGVNIASRIQTMALPGCIYVSEAVHRNISNQPEIVTRFVRQEVLKNVKEGLRIYEVLRQNVSPSDLATTHIPSRDVSMEDKSMAVLPFINMSNDPDQDYFSDGLTMELITNLSRLRAYPDYFQHDVDEIQRHEKRYPNNRKRNQCALCARRKRQETRG
jgi:adenylate cyclase